MSKKKDLNASEIIRFYQEDDLSLRELGTKFNTSKETIKRVLLENNIKIVNKVYKNKGAKGINNGMWRDDLNVDKIIDMYNVQNMSMNAIAIELNVDNNTIKRRLEENNVEVIRKPRSDKSPDNTPAKKKLHYKYRMQAKRRNIEFKLPYQEFTELTQQKCHYCNSDYSNTEITSSGHVLKFNGIDRVDNTRGYTLDNVVPCCKICNQMKSDLGYDVFVNQIKRIYERTCKI